MSSPTPPPPPPGRFSRLKRDLSFAMRPLAGFGQRPGPGRTLRTLAVAAIPSMRHLDMPRGLRRLADLGFAPATIYDIGAASGEWARLAHMLFPKAAIVGFEPNASKKADLDRTKAELPAFRYFQGFLGPKAGEVRYNDSQEQTSLLDTSATNATAPMLVLDELIASGQIPPPDFMKLDVQGFELEVLKGGQNAMSRCQAILLEVTLLPFFDGMPLAADVIRFMGDRGFVWYDLMGAYRRPSDDALLQVDMLFLPQDHPYRRSGVQ